MTTDVASGPGDTGEPPANLAKLNANIARIEELTQRLVQALAHKRAPDPGVEAPAPDLFATAATAYWKEMLENPGKLIESQVGYWGKAVRHYVEAQHLLAQGRLEPPADRGARDRRFANPLWDTHPYFNFLKQQYLINVEAVETVVREIQDVTPLE